MEITGVTLLEAYGLTETSPAAVAVRIVDTFWTHGYAATSLDQIAAATGYSSHGHFTSTFHRLTGKSPTEYRESFY